MLMKSLIKFTLIIGAFGVTAPIHGGIIQNSQQKSGNKNVQTKKNTRYYNADHAFLKNTNRAETSNNKNAPVIAQPNTSQNIPQPATTPNSGQTKINPWAPVPQPEMPNQNKETKELKKTEPNKNGNHPASFYNSERRSLIQVAKDNPNLSTFVTAVEAAGLSDQLDNEGPYTIFAPSNEAFRQLPKGALDRLLKPENQRQLYSIISYHIVPGKVPAKDAKTAKIRTMNGRDVNLEVSRGSIQVGDAEVIRQDLPSQNGMIHIIDEVMLPN